MNPRAIVNCLGCTHDKRRPSSASNAFASKCMHIPTPLHIHTNQLTTYNTQVNPLVGLRCELGCKETLFQWLPHSEMQGTMIISEIVAFQRCMGRLDVRHPYRCRPAGTTTGTHTPAGSCS